jgi:hypothetical protein
VEEKELMRPWCGSQDDPRLTLLHAEGRFSPLMGVIAAGHPAFEV